MTGIPLEISESATVGPDGTARVRLGPTVTRERWNVTQATVTVSTNVLEARCALYLGTVGVQGRLVGQTGTGSSGDTYGFPESFELQPGKLLMAVWEGADVGAIATMNLLGFRLRVEK